MIGILTTDFPQLRGLEPSSWWTGRGCCRGQELRRLRQLESMSLTLFLQSAQSVPIFRNADSKVRLYSSNPVPRRRSWRAIYAKVKFPNQQARVSRRNATHVTCRNPHTPCQSKMASKKLADSTLYHVSPKGFWKKFRTCSRAMGTCLKAERRLCRRRDGCQPRNLKRSPDSFLE